jgi:organic hydroperoxide reductase OsmC/OhrA
VKHHYRTMCTWRGSTAAGYNAYDRGHTVTTPPVDGTLRVSADAAFRGDPALVNPEQLLVAAAASCQLLSFLAVASRARLDVVEYLGDAEAWMPEDDEPTRITRIVLRPRITIRGEVPAPRLAHLSEVAHRECYIANSLRSEIVVEPTFVTTAAPRDGAPA